MPIIEVNNVTKEFKLGQAKSLRYALEDNFHRLIGKEVKRPKPFKALDNVTFKIEPGEVLGIIGNNGAGKSTLLKLLARITVPTTGSVKVKGTVAPLIEVGAGLVGDMTGRENIYLNGTILGLSRAEIKSKFDEIVAFSELAEFIDTPIKRYSSGMAVRLGFAVATSVDADVLIVDEVLAVGDLAFQRKCFDKMEDIIRRQGKTVLLVSHNIRQVERICSRTLLLEKGILIADGKPNKICNMFYERSDEQIKHNVEHKSRIGNGGYETTGEVDLVDIMILDEFETIIDKIQHGSQVTFVLKYKVNSTLVKPVFGLGIHTTDFFYLSTENSYEQLHIPSVKEGEVTVRFRIDDFQYMPGIYSLRVGVAAGDFYCTVFYAENVKHFQVCSKVETFSESMREGFVPLHGHWEVQANDSGESGAQLERGRFY